jgi:tetratricopeptide (TPR) repeat protein
MQRAILTCPARPLTRWLRGASCGLALSVVAGCTPQTALLATALPEGTIPALLANMRGMEEGNKKRIVELETRKDWDGLVKYAEDNLARDPNLADWWLVAGYAHKQAGRHSRAAENFAEAVRRSPDEILGWNLLAQSYRDAKQPQRAVQTLNNALLVRRGSVETWFLLGESYSDLSRYQPAASAYREAVQLDTAHARAWFGLGRAYAGLGQRTEFEQARQALEQLDPALARKLNELRPGPR